MVAFHHNLCKKNLIWNMNIYEDKTFELEELWLSLLCIVLWAEWFGFEFPQGLSRIQFLRHDWPSTINCSRSIAFVSHHGWWVLRKLATLTDKRARKCYVMLN
jgi:hypothetical protein